MSCAMIYWGDHFKKFSIVFSEHGAVVDLCSLQKKIEGKHKSSQPNSFELS